MRAITFMTTDTVYPRPLESGPFDPLKDFDGLRFGTYNIRGIRATLYFGKSMRVEKKRHAMFVRQQRKEMQRLRSRAYGYPVFRCAYCGKAFIGSLTVKESRKQYAEEFPGETWSPCLTIVCDECFAFLQ